MLRLITSKLWFAFQMYGFMLVIVCKTFHTTVVVWKDCRGGMEGLPLWYGRFAVLVCKVCCGGMEGLPWWYGRFAVAVWKVRSGLMMR